jgi:hypothetical protein
LRSKGPKERARREAPGSSQERRSARKEPREKRQEGAKREAPGRSQERSARKEPGEKRQEGARREAPGRNVGRKIWWCVIEIRLRSESHSLKLDTPGGALGIGVGLDEIISNSHPSTTRVKSSEQPRTTIDTGMDKEESSAPQLHHHRHFEIW